MHKFILGENPQAPDTGGTWIIHLPTPQAIIEAVCDGEKMHSKKAFFAKGYEYNNGDGMTEVWQLRLHHYFTTKLPDEAEAHRLVNKMLDDAWHWYVAYMKWEDDNNNLNEYANGN